MHRASQKFSASAALTALVLAAGCQGEPPKVEAPKPPLVLFTQPVSREVNDYEEFIGTTEAVRTVEIRARVSGYLEKIHFEDGSEVAQGTPLVDIDDRMYKAELDRANASIAQAVAHMKRLDADRRRANGLMSKGALSREEFDKTVGDFEESEAAISITRAAKDLAELNLSYTRVEAPISGRLSRRMVDPGNLVKADETALTTIVSLDPIFANFDIDERTLLRIRRLISEGKIQSRQERALVVDIGLADEDGFPHKGTIDFTDNRLDSGTGTLRVRAVVANPKPRIFSPGLFVRIRLPIGTPYKATLITEQALGTDQGRKYVYVVNDKGEVEYRPVKIGLLDQGLRVVSEGLAMGDRVIISGLQRVKPGLKVEAKEAPAAQAGAVAQADGKHPQVATVKTTAPATAETPKPSPILPTAASADEAKDPGPKADAAKTPVVPPAAGPAVARGADATKRSGE
ncbi:efflux RND transporter periplasmic adaptor subunit [Isosphaeraceae bacterium EP7]